MEDTLDHTPNLAPVKRGDTRFVAVAVKECKDDTKTSGSVIASGRGSVARQLLDIAYAHNIKVREDAGLAEILVALDLDTPIPSEAILAVAEILSKIYEANEAETR